MPSWASVAAHPLHLATPRGSDPGTTQWRARAPRLPAPCSAPAPAHIQLKACVSVSASVTPRTLSRSFLFSSRSTPTMGWYRRLATFAFIWLWISCGVKVGWEGGGIPLVQSRPGRQGEGQERALRMKVRGKGVCQGAHQLGAAPRPGVCRKPLAERPLSWGSAVPPPLHAQAHTNAAGWAGHRLLRPQPAPGTAASCSHAAPPSSPAPPAPPPPRAPALCAPAPARAGGTFGGWCVGPLALCTPLVAMFASAPSNPRPPPSTTRACAIGSASLSTAMLIQWDCTSAACASIIPSGRAPASPASTQCCTAPRTPETWPAPVAGKDSSPPPATPRALRHQPCSPLPCGRSTAPLHPCSPHPLAWPVPWPRRAPGSARSAAPASPGAA